MDATKCPSMDEGTKKISHTHTHTHTHRERTLFTHKKEILLFVAIWMDFYGIMLSKISQVENIQMLYDLIYMGN